MTQIPRPNITTGLAIIGPYNTVWTSDVFETPEAAYKHLDAFWKGKWEPRQWRVVPATLTVAVITETTETPMPAIELESIKP